ncbi:MAG: hypothetical protein J0H79_11380 [Alphaproteobacteria bacterium]|nr:hypothetical protein [Alphaproteobacteria bacterium]
MALPPRYAYPLLELAGRWRCTLTDLAEWAAMGHFDFVTSVPRAFCDNKPIAGLVTIKAVDLGPMFRRDWTGPKEVRVFRVKPPDDPEAEFQFITTPERGIKVARADLHVTAADVAKFEEEHELVQKPSVKPSSSRYDWDAMYVHVVKRLHEHGIPETQAEFVGEIQEWFARRDERGEAPDERTIRRRLNPIWRALREVV